MNRYALFFVCIFSTSALPAMAALDPSQPLSPTPPLSLFKAWAKPIKPFQITEGVWYVGTKNLSSILLTTPAGHILIDAGLDESAPQIKANIEAAGFRLTDVRYLLNSHARLDQAGGMARLKAWSGAQLVASQPTPIRWRGVDDRILRLAMRSPSRPSPPIKLSTTRKASSSEG